MPKVVGCTVKLFTDEVLPTFHGQKYMLVKWSGKTSRTENRPFGDSSSRKETVTYSPISLIFRTVRNPHSHTPTPLTRDHLFSSPSPRASDEPGPQLVLIAFIGGNYGKDYRPVPYLFPYLVQHCVSINSCSWRCHQLCSHREMVSLVIIHFSCLLEDTLAVERICHLTEDFCSLSQLSIRTCDFHTFNSGTGAQECFT